MFSVSGFESSRHADEEVLMKRVLGVEADDAGDADDGAEEGSNPVPPQDGEEYLRQVRREAKKMKDVTVAPNASELVKSIQQPSGHFQNVEKQSIPERFVPSLEWQREQERAFSEVRTNLERYQKRVRPQRQSNLPRKHDEKGWCIFCYGDDYWEAVSQERNDDTSAEDEAGEEKGPTVQKKEKCLGNPPLTSVIASLRPHEVEILLKFTVGWCEALGGLAPKKADESKDQKWKEVGAWLYALMCRLEKPLFPDVCSQLRSLTLVCSRQRAEVISAGNDLEMVNALTLIVCLMSKKTVAALFPPFYPVCRALAVPGEQKCPELLVGLRRAVEATPADDLEVLSEHLTFPFEVYLEKPWLNENHTINVLSFVRDFYERVPLRRVQFLLSTTDQTLRLVMNESDQKHASEDLRIAVCKCVASLVKNATSEVLKDFYRHDKTPLLLAQLVKVSLDWIWQDRMIFSIVDSCVCLLESFWPELEGERRLFNQDIDLFDLFCFTFHRMLPGISGKSAKIFLDGAVGLRAKSLVMHCWTRLVCCIFHELHFNSVSDLQLDDWRPALSSNRFSPDQTWLDAATGHISNEVSILTSLASSLASSGDDLAVAPSSIGRIRSQLLESSREFYTYAWSSLGNASGGSMVSLLCSLISSSLENDDKVSIKGKDLLMEILSRMSEDQKRGLASSAQEAIFDATRALGSKPPALLETEKLGMTLAHMQAQILLVKSVEGQSHFFFSETYTGYLVKALVAISRLEDSSCFRDVTAYSSEEDFLFRPELYSADQRPRKDFVYLRTSSLRKRYLATLLCLSECVSLNSLVEYLLGSEVCEESLLLIGDLVDALSTPVISSDHPDGSSLVKRSSAEILLPPLTDRFLDVLRADESEEKLRLESNALVPVNLDSSRPRVQHRSHVDRCWTQTTLAVEGLGRVSLAAKHFGWSEFSAFYLCRCLPLCVSVVDGTSLMQAQVLYNALVDMAEGCDFEDVPSMLSAHLDHLTRNLTLLLRGLGRPNKAPRPGLPILLRAVMRIRRSGGHDLELSSCVTTLLTQLDVSWMRPEAEVTLEMLQVILAFVQGLEIKKITKEEEVLCMEAMNKEEGALTKFIRDLRISEVEDELEDEEDSAVSCPPEGFHQQEGEEDVNENLSLGDEGEEQKVVVSPTVRLLRDVIGHTRHFVSMSKRPEWQIVAMEIVSRSARLISLNTDELLPLIHLCWQPLKLLFDSSNLLILEKSFSVVKVFAELSGDFVRRRTLTDVFPAVMKHTKRLKAVIEDPSRRHTHGARNARKLLSQLLGGLADFLHLLDLDELDVDDVFEELIAASRGGDDDFLDSLCLKRPVDADALWLKTRNLKL